MFTFDNNTLFIKVEKETVIRIRNLSDLEKGLDKPNFYPLEIKNATGQHMGVGVRSDTHATVLYFEEEVKKEPTMQEALQENFDTEVFEVKEEEHDKQ